MRACYRASLQLFSKSSLAAHWVEVRPPLTCTLSQSAQQLHLAPVLDNVSEERDENPFAS